MIRVLFSMSKKPGWSHEKFRDFYETEHAPHARGLPQKLKPVSHKRWLINSTSPLILGSGAQYDMIMELGFRDEEHYKYMEKLIMDNDPDSDVYQAEADFQDMHKLTVTMVERFEED